MLLSAWHQCFRLHAHAWGIYFYETTKIDADISCLYSLWIKLGSLSLMKLVGLRNNAEVLMYN
jgi:hypothetical protein